MASRSAFALLLFSTVLAAQTYKGPAPEKADVPYLLHADNLLETEVNEAKEEAGKKDSITYVIPGAASPVKTPLSTPIFLFQSDKINPDRLQIYKLEVKNGHREVTFGKKAKNNPRPVNVTLNKVSENLYRLEVNESLANGEYSLSPADSNQVFCFSVY